VGINNTGDFPIVGSLSHPFARLNSGKEDAIVMKFNYEGALLWSTCFGGLQSENTLGNTEYWVGPWLQNCITVDNQNGNIFIGGKTQSYINSINYPDFPIVNNNNNSSFNSNLMAVSTGYLAEFSTDQRLIWSTYFGGLGYESITALEIDNTSYLYVAGMVGQNQLPLKNQAGAYFRNSWNGGSSDGFITQFNKNNLNFNYSSYFGCDALGTSPGEFNEIYSIAAKNVTNNPNYSNQFIIVGNAAWPDKFPFKDIPGSNDYFKISIDFGRSFVTNFWEVCPLCQKVSDDSDVKDNWSIKVNYTGTDISIFNDEGIQINNLRILNSIGQTIYNKKVEFNNQYMKIPFKLNPGIYLLELAGNETRTQTIRFFVN